MTNEEREKAIQRARDYYALPSGDSIEIDDEPKVAESEAGCFVAAWVWVPKEVYK